MLAAILVASTAFQVPTAAPPACALRTPALPAKTAPPQMLALPQIAAGANLAIFSLYGTALLFKPTALMKNVMKSDTAAFVEFKGVPCAIAQYLGAIYLSQALRMVCALTVAARLRTDLMGACFIQMFLAITSLARLIGGVEKDPVTLSLPVGQGLMAALSFAGARAIGA